MSSLLDTEAQVANMRDAVTRSIRAAFPVEGTHRTIELTDVWVADEKDPNDFGAQKSAKLRGRSYATPVYAALRLVDNTSRKVLDSMERVKLAELPVMTPRNSFIVKGNEYQVTNQLRLRPGVYTRFGADDQLHSQVNLAKGRNFKVLLDREEGVFQINIGTSNVKLYPVLRDLGVSDGELSDAWGPDILRINRDKSAGVADTEINKLYRNLFYGETPESRESAISSISSYFKSSTKIDPEVTEFTLGKKHEIVSPGLLVDVSKKLLAVAKNEQPEDDRDHLTFKSVHSVDDFLEERLTKMSGKILSELSRNVDRLDKKTLQEIVSRDAFHKPIESLFTQTQLSSTPEQINPLHMVAGLQKITVLGEGGISEKALTPEARGVHPSHLGMIDPIQTPESGAVGAMFRLPNGARKEGDRLKTEVYDPKTDARTRLDAKAMHDKVIAFPDQFKYDASAKKFRPIADKVKAQYRGELVQVSPDKVDFALPTPKSMFGVSVNMIPFLDSNQGNRALTASRMQEQALPLTQREEPLVQSQLGKDTSYEGVLAKQFKSATFAPVDGKVTDIDEQAGVLKIKPSKGSAHTVNFYRDFPLNAQHFFDSELKVKVGDEVKEGQLLADTNYTKDGKLALGTNLNVAYIPYRGYNYEDGVVISESAAQKLTSMHMYKDVAETSADVIVDKAKFLARFPSKFTAAQLANLDDSGVIKEGSEVNEGDPLILAMSKTTARPEDGILMSINRSLVKPYRDSSVVWSQSVPGVVKNVAKHGSVIEVYTRTDEAAVVGDKIAGRHGNKGIIVKVLPDAEMPKTETGESADVLMNPNGVPSRINLGQLLETAVGKVAAKRGQPILVKNFQEGSNVENVQKLLNSAGITDTENLVDGQDGKALGKVNFGKQFIMKLDHSVSKKFHARDTGGYTADELPGKGGHEGAQSIDPLLMYSLLSHGAKENLFEMASVKGMKNDEFWRAYQLGQRLPSPKPSFAFEKFTGMLKGLGVNVEKRGNAFSLVPMTDQDIARMSAGEIKNGKLLKTRGVGGLAEEAGGLFDPAITGGHSGNKWSHVELAAPIPNPLFEDAIKTVLGIKQAEFDALLSGKLAVQPGVTVGDSRLQPTEQVAKDAKTVMTGGSAFQWLLSQVDVDKELKRLREEAVGTKGQKLNTYNKHIRYLQALKNNGLDPTVYVTSKVPVIPPKFRPVYPTNTGQLVTSDVNLLYKDVILANEALKEKKALGFPADKLGESVAELYNQHKLLSGLGGEATSFPGVRDPKGIITTITGLSSPKSGFYQSKLVRRRQDLSARSTIIPEPQLGVDEVGIPKDMLKTIFRKPVVRRLVNLGYTPLQAQEAVDKGAPSAQRALELEAEARPVLLNRAPSLHKFSMMAFKPRIVEGKAIKLHPLVVKGFGADFDGDQQNCTILLSISGAAGHRINSMIDSSGGGVNKAPPEGCEVAARFKVTLPRRDDLGHVYVADLSEFPHGKLARTLDTVSGSVELYEVEPGVRVLAYDDTVGEHVWADVAYFSKHPAREVEVVTLQSGRQIVTDNDPRAVYGTASGEIELRRFTPCDALASKVLVPRALRLELARLESGVDTYSPELAATHGMHHRNLVLRSLKLDGSFGYLCGAAAGNGWVDVVNGVPKAVNFAAREPNVWSKYIECTNSVMYSDVTVSETTRDRDDPLGYGPNHKASVGSRELAETMLPLIGKHAANKHLPPFYLTAPKDFRLGLFAGLMDTDGTISVSTAKKNPQLMSSYSTNSLRLAREVVLLAASLGISGRITASQTPAGLPHWVVSFSNAGIQKWDGHGMVHADKLAKLRSVPEIKDSPVRAKYDVVPISRDLAATAMFLQGAPRGATKEHRQVYHASHAAKRDGYTSRQSAKRLLEIKGLEKHPDFDKFRDIVNNTDITWDIVESVEKTGIHETGYDLTVPGYETFMNVEGVILSNTMAVHVPVTEKAVKEAYSMMPTNNLYNPGTGDMMVMPGQEAVLGLYRLTEAGRITRKKFKDFEDARSALTRGEISATDVVTIGKQKTTVGRVTVNMLLPESMRDFDATFDKKHIAKVLGKVATLSPQEFGEVADGLKDIGNEHSYRVGSTISLSDVVPMAKERDAVFKALQPQLKSIDAQLVHTKDAVKREALQQKKVDLYNGAADKLDELVKKLPSDNNVRRMVVSGARGNFAQVRQMIGAPVLLTDPAGKPIPVPVTKSYAEGLDTAGYWLQSYGARTGAVDRSLQTSVPGYFQKRLINTMLDMTVTSVDCGTTEGVEVDVDDPKIIDRYTAGDKFGVPRNTPVNTSVISVYRRHKKDTIKVRSPMTCEAKEGVCAKCFGKRENGRDSNVGDNVGAMSAQSIAEPATQMQMKTFHTGGVAAGGIGSSLKSGFERILQLTELPATVQAAATLAEDTGVVDSVVPAPAGGSYIYVSGKRHFVPAQNTVTVDVGQRVNKGDALSSGEQNPHDILRLRGVQSVRSHLFNELNKEYSNQGIRIKAPVLEAAVRSLTNLTRIKDPGTTDFAPGDFAPLSKVEAMAKAGQTVRHEPELKGINQAPLFGNEDWLSQLNFQNLKKTVLNAATKGWSSSIHGTNPVAAWVYGAEFGRGDKPGEY